MDKIRLLLVDDHTLVRQGLRNILESEPDFEIVGEAENGQKALELAQELLPDVVLTDIRMGTGDGDGVTATRRIRASVPSAKVIVLTNYDEDELVFASIRAGAAGYLLKEVQSQQLIDAVRHVAAGYTLVYPSVAKRVLDEFGQPKTPAPSATDGLDAELADLTARERQILRLIAHGRTNKDIGATLGITERTVKTHVSNIFAKLQLSDRTQAALFAHRKGLGD
jgi:NarL family two-component system response regulator LiaR